MCRSSTPALSSSRRRSLSVRGGTPRTACRNSLNRCAPDVLAQSTEITCRRSRMSATRRTSSGTGWQLRQRNLALRLEGEVDYLADRHDRVERELLPDGLGDVIQIASVPLGHDYVGDAGRVRREDLLLEAADRQHPSLQGHLAGHP